MNNAALQKAMQDAADELLRNQRTDSIYGVKEGSANIALWPAHAAPIVFLDFDGVLNSEASIAEFGTQYRFAQSNVAALNMILRGANALVVITSSWRECWTLSENAGFLQKAGVERRRVVGRTPQLGQARGHDIDSWLRSVPFRVSSFVILDDRDDMAMHCRRLVQTDAKVGLTEALALQALDVLEERFD